MTVDEAIRILGITPEGVAERINAVPKGPQEWEEKTEVFRRTVREARKRVLLKWHPDHCKLPEATERTQQINNVADQLLKLHLRPKRPHAPPPGPFPSVRYSVRYQRVVIVTGSSTGTSWWDPFGGGATGNW